MTPGCTETEINSAILEVALSLDDPESRGEFLDRVFGTATQARKEMDRMLDAADNAAEFFLEAREERTRLTADLISESKHQPRAAPPRLFAPDAPPERLGPYRLIARLGEGGGGVVYEAEQEHPISRRVALKIVRMGVENRQALARFDVERQALALMDHPNIAKVFDAGTTPDGKPYFVMELVTGEPIVSYCNRHRLTLTERLEVFTEVCSAIQHAHQKGVIHRDIKPTNVIVTRQDGAHVPKIIDFGIAKAAGTARAESITAHDQFFGTPAYMSPEQVALTGIDVDTRSDIFSLGVLLHELLTGSTPSPPQNPGTDLSLSRIRKSLLDRDIIPPSELFGSLPADQLRELATERSSEPSALASFVKGDLDCIVLMALEKNRMRRYQTANGLATDIRRFLTYQPVFARPPSAAYVLTKFMRRNRLACGAAAAFVSLLVVALATTATMYERERQAANEQLRLKNEAQAARQEESRLRRQADARSNIARTAFLLDQGRVSDADELRQAYPLSSIEPSLEAAAVFRSLGDWNSEHGRWDQALQCYRLLHQANRQDVPQKIVQGDDLMAISAALLRHDPAEYRAFRDDVVARYAPSDGKQKAEHLLKVCLIHPAGSEVLEAMKQEVETMGDPLDTPCPAWSALSLALYHLRCGDSESALNACRVGLALPERKTSCEVSLESVVAMAHFQAGRPELARPLLDKARASSEACKGKDFAAGEPIDPHWFDWAIANLLIQEAGTLSPTPH